MTLRECYEKMNGDYDDIMARLESEGLAERFLLKFLNEKSMQGLRDAVASGDIEESFKAAHTLKGVTANLSITALMNVVSELTEQLRPRTEQASAELMEQVEQQYEIAIATISEFAASKEQ